MSAELFSKKRFFGIIKLFLVCLTLVNFPSSVFSQKTVTGKVINNSGVPLERVSVMIKGTTRERPMVFGGIFTF